MNAVAVAVVEWETFHGTKGQMQFTANDPNNSRPGTWGMLRDAIEFRDSLKDTGDMYTCTLRFN